MFPWTLLYFLLCHFSVSYQGQLPMMDASYQIIPTGSSFTLTCPVETKIDWLKPKRYTEEDVFYILKKVKPVSQRSIISGSKLTVTDASYLDTGYYSCHLVDDKTAVFRQFIFVEDPQHLFLPPALQLVGPNQDLRVIGYYSESDVVIGCAPTHPSVAVNLRKFSDDGIKVIASSSNPNDPDSDFTFDQFEGFKIKTVNSWDLKGQHDCDGTWPKSELKITSSKFKIKIQGLEVTPLDQTVVEGDQVTLTCRSKNKDDMQMSWRWLIGDSIGMKTKLRGDSWIQIDNFPADMIPSENETSQQEYPALGTFEVYRLGWRHIPQKASGIYQCYDAYNDDIPASNITLKVLAARPPIFDDVKVDLQVERGQDISLICGDSKALPPPVIHWFKLAESDDEVEIKNDKPKYYAITDGTGSSQLTVHYAASDAVYKCRVINWAGQQEKKFNVSVINGGTAIMTQFVLLLGSLILHYLVDVQFSK